ncbi:MAG: hypothetical protein JRF31_07615 [Deltaproteobacteria bacterium]|nr:hypothetical protein [Deltaproteobacteria bacterium]
MLLGNSLKYVPIDRALKRNVILKNQSLKEIGQGVPMKNHPAFTLALIFLLLISSVGYGNEYPSQEVVEQRTEGIINWSRGVIQAKGIGVLHNKCPDHVKARSTALKNARLDACRKILEVAKGIRIDGTTVVGDYEWKNDIIMSKIESMVKDAEIVKKDYFSDGTVKVTMEMNLRGGFAQLVLPGEIQPLESIRTMAPVKNSPSIFTGLVVDTRGLGTMPVMAPKILDENAREVYGSAFVSREYAVQQGMCGYSKGLAKAQNNLRVGDNPLMVKGLRTEGVQHSDVIISNVDASRLRSASENLSFMKKCRVIIVVE